MHARPVLRVAAATAAATAAILLAACNGSGENGGALSKREFIEQADEICATTNAQAAAVAPPSLADPLAVEQAVAQIVAIQRDALAQLRALEPPADDVPGVDAWLDLVDETLDEMEKVRKGLRDGDQEAIDTANANAVALSNEAEDAAISYGVFGCTTEVETEATEGQ